MNCNENVSALKEQIESMNLHLHNELMKFQKLIENLNKLLNKHTEEISELQDIVDDHSNLIEELQSFSKSISQTIEDQTSVDQSQISMIKSEIMALKQELAVNHTSITKAEESHFTEQKDTETKIEATKKITAPYDPTILKQLQENQPNFNNELYQIKRRTAQNELNMVTILNNYLSALKEKVPEIAFFDFDDYQEESLISEGATSCVKVVGKKTPEKFAKKELKEFDFVSFKRFLNEAEILFKLRHPCIIRIYGVNHGDDKHPPSILLSLEPNSLENAINNKILTKSQKNKIAVEIVLGMRYIHSNNFIHRDLKPLNILLSKNLHVRISDFGLAKEDEISISLSKGVGTLRFMAPELFEEDDNGIAYTNKVDVYAFGITLIFIISDMYPKLSLKNVSNGILPSLPETITGWVRELIVRCLSPSPEERPSFTEIFEIMKSNKYDMFNEINDSKLSSNQKLVKDEIEKRIVKILAFEYQHRDDFKVIHE